MPRWGWAVLALQSLILGVMVFHHVRWEDEAQAWLLARDDTPWDLILHRLRYEGSPGLWHLLLMPFAKAGLPFATIGVISGVAAVVAAYMFLRFSPFPAVVRALFPFSYHVLYQYGVIARSYCLIAPLLFGIVMLYPRWRQRPVTMMILLVLLANVSVHGLLITLGIVAASLPPAIRRWPSLPRPLRRRHVAAAGAGALVLVGLVAILWLPRDFSGGDGGGSWNLSVVHLLQTSWLLLVDATAVSVISVVVVLATWLWFWRSRNALLYAVPMAMLAIFYSVKYVQPWHEGIIVLLWIAMLWLGLNRQMASGVSRPRSTAGMCAALSVALLVQVSWSAISLIHESTHPYSSASAALTYLRTHGLISPNLELAEYPSVAVLAQLSEPTGLMINGGHPTTYWLWTNQEWRTTSLAAAVARGHVYLLVPIKRADAQVPCVAGYRRVADFSGALFDKTHVTEGEAAVLFEKTEAWNGFEPANPGWCGGKVATG